jgi:hypothetical protein
MPKRRVPEPEEPAAEAASEAAPEATAEAVPDEEAAPVFANRAERRAHGRGKAQPPAGRKGHVPVTRGSVPQPRQWGNRRSG